MTTDEMARLQVGDEVQVDWWGCRRTGVIKALYPQHHDAALVRLPVGNPIDKRFRSAVVPAASIVSARRHVGTSWKQIV